MIEYVKRLAGPFTSEGQTQLPFGFYIFEKTDVYVATADDPDAQSTMLVYGQDYSVEMNSDQDATPGGTVTLTIPIVKGQIFVVGSAVAYTQNMQLTNYSRFPPEIINKAMDRVVVQVQQIVERLGRTLSVPPTSSSTPEQLIEKLLAAQKEAAKYASQAGESLKKTQQIEQRLTDQEAGIAAQLTEKGNALLSQITTEGSSQQALVKAEGDKQVERIQSLYDVAALSEGMACSRRMIEVSADVPAGTEIVLPNGQQYVVGRNHLLLFYNDLYIDPAHFAEVGTVDTLSNRITLTFDMKHNVGRPNRLTALVIPLGREEVHEMLERVKVVEDALANLSRNVAYLERN